MRPLLLLLVLSAQPSHSGPVSLTVDMHWRGLGEPVHEHYALAVDGRQLDATRAQALADAIAAKPMSRDAALRTLASPSWLRKYAGPGYHVLSAAQGACSAEARDLFTRTFTDPEEARGALRDHYEGFHTDDFAAMEIVVRFSDGTSVSANARSQHALMLPWKTNGATSWNPDISRALAAILPPSSKQRARLTDDRLAGSLAREIGQRIRERWEDLEERCLYAPMWRSCSRT